MLRLKISISEFKSNLFLVIPSFPKLHFSPHCDSNIISKTLFFWVSGHTYDKMWTNMWSEVEWSWSRWVKIHLQVFNCVSIWRFLMWKDRCKVGPGWLLFWILNLKQEIVICVPQKNPMTIEQLGQVLKTWNLLSKAKKSTANVNWSVGIHQPNIIKKAFHCYWINQIPFKIHSTLIYCENNSRRLTSKLLLIFFKIFF